MAQGTGFAGIPPGPLSAYLGVKAANEQQGQNDLQSFGMVQGLLAKMQTQARENEFRAAIAQAKTPEEQAAVSIRFGGPEGVIKHLDRQAQIEATKEMGKARLQQAANQLEMQNQFHTARIDSIKDETVRKRQADAWQQKYQAGQQEIAKQHLEIQRMTADPMGLFRGGSPGASAAAPVAAPAQAPVANPTAAPIVPVQPGITTPPAQGPTGEEFLKTLPPMLQAEVKARAEGDRMPPTGFALKSPYFQQLMTAVQQYDPSYTDRRYSVKQEHLGKGVTKNILTNVNQAITHMGTLYDLSVAMKNSNLQAQTAIVNFVRKQFGDEKITNPQLARKAVSDEMMRVFRGSGVASQQEAKDFEERLNTFAGSPAQQIGAIQTAAKLIEGRVKVMEDQYVAGMGHERFRRDLITPTARKQWEKIRSDAGSPAGASTEDQALIDKYLKR